MSVRRKGTQHALPTPAQHSLMGQEHANAPVACSAQERSAWRARVCQQVYLCAGRSFAALVTVGAQNMLLFVGSFGALSTLLYATPTTPLLFASLCAHVASSRLAPTCPFV